MNFNQNKFAYAYMSLIAEQNEETKDFKSEDKKDEDLTKTGDIIDGKLDNDKQDEEDIVDGDSEIKTIKFVTSDKDLIDALSNDFEKITIFVKSKQDDKDELEEVEILKDSFGPIEVLDVEEDQGEFDDEFEDYEFKDDSFKVEDEAEQHINFND